ncbi:histone-lysine N-methyltransferase SETMAR-like [Toxorhynchites rutilus septentrionalis]|uniref:histone-lysine N-methyltransferase SETMAR-like n=1 Tax=Toxorhynchites rutilus septentrionalis TaxID=329112 RepID=UPI002479F87D|nr:histone-lysine N-methyltransferase SETMAR-like [Toxorhynchites rutilus septentrionalis]
MIYCELLPYGQTLNSDLYCQQLDRLKVALMKKRPSLINRGRIVFHQDNARPHTSLATRQKLRELGLEVLLQIGYPSFLPIRKRASITGYYYDKGKNASQVANKICAVYGPDTVSISTAQRWFQRFRSGVEVVEDAPRSGRPVVENCDKIAELAEKDRHSSSRSIDQELGISHQTVINHLKKLRFTKKLDVWVPHTLTQKNIFDRIDACESLLNRNKIDPFPKRMVTGDEKWVTYDNVKRKRSWSKPAEAAQTVAKPS